MTIDTPDQRVVTLGKIIDGARNVAPPFSAVDQAALAGEAYSPAAPTISAVTPGTGAAAGGTAVVVTGTNLAGCSAVLFDGTPGTALSVTSNTEVEVTTPAHAAATVDVTAVTPGGAAVDADGFTYT